MADAVRLFILAGESSGDRLGAGLVEALGAITDLDLSGVGGPALEAVGLESLYPMDDLSVMGLVDVLKRLPLLIRREQQTIDAIIAADPELVVLIDSQTFSFRIAHELRNRGAKMPIALYVAPAVWAWKPKRAARLKPLVQTVLAVLPFEPEVMARLGGPPTAYVGHPALTETRFAAREPVTGALALFPGSRSGELRRHLPLFKNLVLGLAGHPAIEKFILPTLPGLAGHLRAETANWPAPVEIIVGTAERQKALASTIAAVACSGTVTLELALAGIPMITLYVPDMIQLFFWRRLGRPPIALPNILSGENLVPECHPGPELAETLLMQTLKLLDHTGARTAQHAAFRNIRTMMEEGTPQAPRADPVKILIDLVEARKAAGG